MIPEKEKVYYIEFLDSNYPPCTHYEGPGIWTGEVDRCGTENTYHMRINDTSVEDGYFQEKYIIRELEENNRFPSKDTSLKKAREKIKILQELLYEAVQYVRSEKILRYAWEGPNKRLDREAERLIEEINNQFTEAELKEAHETYIKK